MTIEPISAASSPRGRKRSDQLKVWLADAVRRQAVWCFAGGAALAAASAVAAYLTYNVLWFVFLFCGGSLLGSGTLYAAGLATLALLPIHLTTNRAHLENLKFERNPHLRLAYRVAPIFDAGWVALANRQNFESFVKLISLGLLAWPALATGAWRSVAKGLRLRSLEVSGPAKVLSHLLTQERKFPLEELVEKLPKLDPQTALVPLFDVDGVLFRATPPPGLSLEDDLRRQLTAYLSGESARPQKDR